MPVEDQGGAPPETPVVDPEPKNEEPFTRPAPPEPPPLVPVTSHRHALTTWCAWGVAHRAHINYAEVRPIPVGLPHGTLPFTTDCSGFVTLMSKWAGCPDPNGRGYDGQGFTGTILAHCQHIDADDAKAGDLIVYGPDSGDHVVVIVGVGFDGLGTEAGDFRVVSHGRQGDPIQTTNRVEAEFHRPPQRFVRWLP